MNTVEDGSKISLSLNGFLLSTLITAIYLGVGLSDFRNISFINECLFFDSGKRNRHLGKMVWGWYLQNIKRWYTLFSHMNKLCFTVDIKIFHSKTKFSAMWCDIGQFLHESISCHWSLSILSENRKTEISCFRRIHNETNGMNLSVIRQKGEHSYPVRIRRQEMFVFWKIWRALFPWNTRFDIYPFALLPTKWVNEIEHHTSEAATGGVIWKICFL